MEGAEPALGGRWPGGQGHCTSSPLTQECDVPLAAVLLSLCNTIDLTSKYTLSLPPASATCDKLTNRRTQRGPAGEWEAAELRRASASHALSAGPVLAGPPAQAGWKLSNIRACSPSPERGTRRSWLPPNSCTEAAAKPGSRLMSHRESACCGRHPRASDSSAAASGSGFFQKTR